MKNLRDHNFDDLAYLPSTYGAFEPKMRNLRDHNFDDLA